MRTGLTAISFAIFVAFAGSVTAQLCPLTYGQLLTALNSKVPRGSTKPGVIKKIIADIEQRGVDRPLTDELAGLLWQAGATDELMTALEENAPLAFDDSSATKDLAGSRSSNQIKVRVDNFYLQLENNPTAKGYIINYGPTVLIRKRRADIERVIAFRRYDRSRVSFIDAPYSGQELTSKLFIVPDGADAPEP